MNIHADHNQPLAATPDVAAPVDSVSNAPLLNQMQRLLLAYLLDSAAILTKQPKIRQRQ